MLQLWHSWRRVLYLCSVVAMWCVASSPLAAELRPYNPPSVQQQPSGELRPFNPPSVQRQAPGPKSASDSREKFFLDFEEKVKKLSQDERKDLQATLQKEYNTASQMKDVQRMGYYATLLQILSSQ